MNFTKLEIKDNNIEIELICSETVFDPHWKFNSTHPSIFTSQISNELLKIHIQFAAIHTWSLRKSLNL